MLNVECSVLNVAMIGTWVFIQHWSIRHFNISTFALVGRDEPPKEKVGPALPPQSRSGDAQSSEAVEPDPDDVVVEIGPGEGVLTEKPGRAAERAGCRRDRPRAFRKAARPIRQSHHARETKTRSRRRPYPPARTAPSATLPTDAGTPILRRVVADPNCRRAVFRLQKEVADRLVANPGDGAYGYLTLFVRLYSSARILMTLEPKSFYPPTESAQRRGDSRSRPEAVRVRGAHQTDQRLVPDEKKETSQQLDGVRTREEIVVALARAGINEGVRAERLSVEDFARLWSELDQATRCIALNARD